jgi:hypothetical protein
MTKEYITFGDNGKGRVLSMVETWVPLGPTDQAHGRPRRVGPAY